MPAPRSILVTGANRGIGHAICTTLLANPSANPLTLYAASRKGEDLNLQPQHPSTTIQYPRLDISSHDSIHALAERVRSEQGSLDVLVNNAGTNLDKQYSYDNARTTMDVNYRGTLEMCTAFLALLKASPSPSKPRIVNLTSVASTLKHYTPALQARFRDPDLTLSALEAIAREFEASVQTSSEHEAGFPAPNLSYSVSKAHVNAFTRVLARENPEVLVNCCCPGWVATDLGSSIGRAPKTAEEGARIPVRLAAGEVGGVSGGYWANEGVRGKGEGEVRQW